MDNWMKMLDEIDKSISNNKWTNPDLMHERDEARYNQHKQIMDKWEQLWEQEDARASQDACLKHASDKTSKLAQNNLAKTIKTTIDLMS